MLKPGAEWADCVDLYEAEAARQILSDCRSELKKKKKGGRQFTWVAFSPLKQIMQLCLLCRRWFKTITEIFQNFTFISSHWFLLALVVDWTAVSVDHVSFQIGTTQLDSFPSDTRFDFFTFFFCLYL